jgi:hypothetical protein
MSYPPGAGSVLVRLSDIPIRTRVAAAERIIRVEGLRQIEALELRLAAAHPRSDPAVRVEACEAERVLGR